jgi:hypothetical protein
MKLLIELKTRLQQHDIRVICRNQCQRLVATTPTRYQSLKYQKLTSVLPPLIWL